MAGKYDLAIEAGATYLRTFTWSTGSPPVIVNLTGYTAHATIRDKWAPLGTVLLDLTVGSGLTLGGSAGTVTMLITPTQTVALPPTGVWDLKMTAPDGTVTRLLAGLVAVSPEVTV